MYLVQTVAPISEPITLEEAKDFMRILEADDDALITAMIESAREFAENYTNRQIISATYELYTEWYTQDMVMPKNPIQSITSIEYMDEAGTYQTLDPTLYYLYGENDLYKIHFEEDLPEYKEHKKAIKITFVAGYTTVPSAFASYMKVFVSNLYENREFYVIGTRVDKMANPLVVKMLDMYRVQPL